MLFAVLLCTLDLRVSVVVHLLEGLIRIKIINVLLDFILCMCAYEERRMATALSTCTISMLVKPLHVIVSSLNEPQKDFIHRRLNEMF